MARIVRKTFTTGTSWTCPAGVTKILAFGMGGGGGGAGNGSDAGGSGANMVFYCLDVVPNTSYTITIGSGGSGGSAGGSGSGDGGDTSIGSLEVWNGGEGGGTTAGDPSGATINANLDNRSNHCGADENRNECPTGYPGNNYSGGTSYAEAGGGGAGGRGDGGNGGSGAAGSSASANTGAGGGAGPVGYAGGSGGSGYLELVWSE